MPLKKQSDEEKVIHVDVEKRKVERNFENLKNQLFSRSVTERRWAARDLAQYPEASSILLQALKKEKDLSVREVILSSLLTIKDEVAVEGLVELLKSDDAHLRNEAIGILKQIPNEVAPYIEKLIKSPDPDLRIFAINIMESLRYPKVLEWLSNILENDENVNVCATALDLLAEIGDKEHLPLIRRVKEKFKDEPYIQFAADLAIRRIDENEGCG